MFPATSQRRFLGASAGESEESLFESSESEEESDVPDSSEDDDDGSGEESFLGFLAFDVMMDDFSFLFGASSSEDDELSEALGLLLWISETLERITLGGVGDSEFDSELLDWRLVGGLLSSLS